MPRKYWQQKNRYCWNSNLDEEMFLCLVKLYCKGHSCSKAARVIQRYARVKQTRTISRQTINRYFLLFGDYLYAKLPRKYQFAHVKLEGGEAFAGVEIPEEYTIQLIIMALHQALYGKLDYRDQINKILISSATPESYAQLVKLSKSKRGIPITAFITHFTLCLWLMLVKTTHPDQDPSTALFEMMIAFFEEAPIGTFELRSIRLVRN
ncbi:MAG: hypothetical protein JKY46_08610 [Robiginitomaculum sp.]|nr:hypothetical protein [Robiginitomaculum sp.]